MLGEGLSIVTVPFFSYRVVYVQVFSGDTFALGYFVHSLL